jgi:murein DD-endopeptidase MepM/ murein hydrolase activator NlpD
MFIANCRNRYGLPLSKKSIAHWHISASLAHVGKLKYALDFYAKEGTPIKAALDGEVVYVKRGSKVGGLHKRFYFLGNRIVIKHKNGEYTAYEHMKYGGVFVRKGQSVRRGQRIGLVGSTGWSFAPHLHFEVFSKPDRDQSEGTTLKTSFRLKRGISCWAYCWKRWREAKDKKPVKTARLH